MDLTNGQGVDVAIDYVSHTSTLETACKSLGHHGRMVTLGGAGESFNAGLSCHAAEQDLLGSRYVTRAELLATYDLIARGDVLIYIVSDIRPLEEAEAVHELVEKGDYRSWH